MHLDDGDLVALVVDVGVERDQPRLARLDELDEVAVVPREELLTSANTSSSLCLEQALFSRVTTVAGTISTDGRRWPRRCCSTRSGVVQFDGFFAEVYAIYADSDASTDGTWGRSICSERGRQQSAHPPHATPITTDTGGALLASWTRMSRKPASCSQAWYDSALCTPPTLVRVSSPAA